MEHEASNQPKQERSRTRWTGQHPLKAICRLGCQADSTGKQTKQCF